MSDQKQNSPQPQQQQSNQDKPAQPQQGHEKTDGSQNKVPSSPQQK